MTTQRKAVALISGGLDSLLAAKLMLDQGILVEGLNFYTGFCHSGHTSAIRKKPDQQKPKRNDALWAAEQLGIKLHIIDTVEAYRNIVINPQYGYGKHLNPCLDCKIFMIQRALDWMTEHGFDFIITGEVVGQRPKSQRKNAMPIVARESGAHDRLLRPLCARNLPPTLPEKEGWIDRDRLLGLSGRNRTPQIDLAKQWGFDDYAQPSGGCCVLTDESYSRKLSDLWEYRNTKEYDLDDIILLKVGRHIRPKKHFKLIIGREEGENRFLEGYRKQFISMEATRHMGPLVLIDGEPNEQDLHLAAQITARYTQGRDAPEVCIQIRHKTGAYQDLTVQPFAVTDLPEAWHV